MNNSSSSPRRMAHPQPASAASSRSTGSGAAGIIVARLALLLIILLAWELASGRLVATFYASKPSQIAAVLWMWLRDGSLFFHMSITALEAFLGFVIGGVLGMAVGIAMGRSPRLAQLLDPFIMTFYSLPKVALAPLFILWLGIGLEMKVALTAAIVFFLVFLNTYTGVRNVSRELESILRLMGANERDVLTKVVLPSAVTWVFAGLRISVPYALIGAIVGELMASNKGLGSLLVLAQGQLDTAGVFAALAAIMCLAIVMNLLVKAAETRMTPWKSAEGQRELSI
ncbi:ABC transporter permease [Roseateles toxinivorans]|uniref:NitT/TauT family transport system permease protein n=1 Tax=Roseateles toxinivorans TaxID=270368 RepID=A0A4R6QGA4_9BURK|nr:ABC transporter permease [Roseateles toxinivorans]TDP62056.1 NitT/TauT family transport system permease protein [Roseateles toxinivorans]